MPTGYTHDVQEGKITDFPTFALRCARAFGALILMRDEPASAPIPDEFPPDTFYAKRATEAREELARLEAMTTSEIVAAAAAHSAQAIAKWETRQEKVTIERNRYNAMLAKAVVWKPPTPEHEGLRTFMIDQLRQSIDFDCPTTTPEWDRRPEPISNPEAWHAERIAHAKREIARYDDEQAKENERAAGRTAWVRALRESLEQKEAAQ